MLSRGSARVTEKASGDSESEDFSLLVAFLLVTFLWLFRGLFCLEKQCSGLFRYFFVAFSWFFLGPLFGQILRVLALEQSSDSESTPQLSWWYRKFV